ncbi:flagellar biosynthesis protein FlgN [Fervidobacterium sp.]
MLIENLKNEIRVLDSMIQAFRGLESAMLNKQPEMVSKYALSIEELSLEISLIESEREKFLQELGYSSVRQYVEAQDGEDISQVAYLSAEIVEKLNELTIVMDGIRQIVEFENYYFELLNNLVRGVNPSSNYSYTQNKQGISSYLPTNDSPRYDRLK